MAAFEALQEVHCCSLESQSNIYGLSKVDLSADETRLLIVSLRGKVLCVGFNEKMIPSSREVHFTYIPGDAEIVSISSFKKCLSGCGIVVGIAFIKCHPPDGKPIYFLNIYSDSEVESDLDRIAQGCQSLPLSFLPYQLYHTQLFHPDGSVEMVFLLSGADQKIHMFQEAKDTHSFTEEENFDDYFPEMVDLPGIVTRLQCVYFDDNRRRLTAIGCQNGFVGVSMVDIERREILKEVCVQHDSPITSINLFELVNYIPIPDALMKVLDIQPEKRPRHEFHLLVASSLEPATVYMNILEREFSDPLLLPESDSYDCVMCSLVTDVDFDGENEIVLGTYGQELLVYKLQIRQPKSRKSSYNVSNNESTASSDNATPSDSGSLTVPGARVAGPPGNVLDKEFALICRRSMPEPVMALEEADLMSDGMNEIVILTLKGLHVLQHDLIQTSELCISRLNQLFESHNLRSEAPSQSSASLVSSESIDSSVESKEQDCLTNEASEQQELLRQPLISVEESIDSPAQV